MDIREVALAIHRASGLDPVARVLTGLEHRQGELVAALGGEGLRVELIVIAVNGQEARHLIEFTPDGRVLRLRPGGALAGDFDGHITVHGHGVDIVGLVLGEIDVATAVYRGLLELRVPPDDLVPRYARLMRVLAIYLLDLADGDACAPGERGDAN